MCPVIYFLAGGVLGFIALLVGYVAWELLIGLIGLVV